MGWQDAPVVGDSAPAKEPAWKNAPVVPETKVTPLSSFPHRDPNRVENALRGFFGAPKVGEDPGYEIALSADSPFPEATPVSPAIFKDAASLAGGAVKGLIRGGKAGAQAIQDSLGTFAKAGTSPTLGQALGRPAVRSTESVLGKFAGSSGVMARKQEQQLTQLGEQTSKLADRLARAATPSVAGRTLEKGLTGEGGFISRFRAGQNALYQTVDRFIPGNTVVSMENTAKTLAAMNQDIPGAEALSRFFKNAKIEDIKQAFQADVAGARPGVMIVPPNAPTRPGGLPGYQGGRTVGIPGGAPANRLPYEAVKRLRTLVGQQLETGSITSDVPRSKWKAFYASLSQDLDGAATATGNPAAVKAMKRANDFSRAGHERIGDILEKVTKQDLPEKVFEAATNVGDMKAGASKIAGIMRSLQPGERDVVRSAFINRMGFPPDSAQFNAKTFLNNWHNMSGPAKAVMFADAGGDLRKSLDAIAKVASLIKEAPPSHFLSPHSTGVGVAAGAATALATGHIPTAAAFLGTAGAANLTARLMTNPRFVKWLATSSRAANPEVARQALLGLGRVMQKESADVQQDAAKYREAVDRILRGAA